MLLSTGGQTHSILIGLFLGLSITSCATKLPSREASEPSLVGTWYGEMPCGPQCGQRDYLRWTRVNSEDGVQHVHFRYYWKGEVQQNVFRSGRWGYNSGTYWLTCEKYFVDGEPRACPSPRYEFVVESLQFDIMTYYSEEHSIRYTARRVANDFNLDEPH